MQGGRGRGCAACWVPAGAAGHGEGERCADRAALKPLRIYTALGAASPAPRGRSPTREAGPGRAVPPPLRPRAPPAAQPACAGPGTASPGPGGGGAAAAGRGGSPAGPRWVPRPPPGPAGSPRPGPRPRFQARRRPLAESSAPPGELRSAAAGGLWFSAAALGRRLKPHSASSTEEKRGPRVLATQA